MISYNYLIFCIFQISKIHAEYRIKEGAIGSFLNYSFTDLSELIFPSDLTLYLSLSRAPGTLLYSVDNKDNQLIITINDDHAPTLDIEFNKQHFYASLSKLCGLERAKYNNLTLRMQMREVIYIRCNEATMQSFKYGGTKEINKDYPIPKFHNTDKLQAYLWLVNTPYMDDIYPNNAQLSGCIFEVRYKKELLKMGTHGVGDKCPITCTKNVCNEGKCLETYNSEPVCNCTDSFMNGKFCGAEIRTGNYQFADLTNLMTKSNDNKSRKNGDKKVLQLSAAKIVFVNAADDLFELRNEIVSLKLVANGNNLKLIIDCNQLSLPIKIESTISNNYKKTDKHIVILEFNKLSVDWKYHSKISEWTYLSIPIRHDFSREIFHQLILRGDDSIEMSIKNDIKEIRWSTLDYSKNYYKTELLNTASTTRTTTSMINTTAKGTGIKYSIPNVEGTVLKITDSCYVKCLSNVEGTGLEFKVNLILGIVFVLLVAILIILVLFIRKLLTKRFYKLRRESVPITIHVGNGNSKFDRMSSDNSKQHLMNGIA